MQTNKSTEAVHVELEGVIRAILAEELDLEPGELSLTADLVDEYDADSLSLITVVARIEKQLGVKIPMSLQEGMTNLAGVLAAVHQARDLELDGV
jgi:acyl carrier protein